MCKTYNKTIYLPFRCHPHPPSILVHWPESWLWPWNRPDATWWQMWNHFDAPARQRLHSERSMLVHRLIVRLFWPEKGKNIIKNMFFYIKVRHFWLFIDLFNVKWIYNSVKWKCMICFWILKICSIWRRVNEFFGLLFT